VVRPVVERHAHVVHGVPGQHAGRQRLADALLDRLDELPRDGAADDVVDELEPLRPALRGATRSFTWPLLPAAAGLPDVAPLALGGDVSVSL